MTSRIVLAALLASLAACGAPPPDHLRIAGADVEEGRLLIHRYGCGTCHQIEGIRGAHGRVGPQLEDYAQRHLLAGILPNTPRFLIAWIVNAPALDPRTGMPNLGVSEPEARHIAAYLYSLGARDAQVYPAPPPLELRGEEEPLQAYFQPLERQEPSPTTPRTRRGPPSAVGWARPGA